jgi:leader peptidase (prepilin peptidase)/N-methyltransferase
VLVFVYDLRHTIIPNEFVLGLIAIATFVVGYESYHAGMQHIATSLLGGIIAAAFFWGIWLYSKGRWIGLGDAKLALPLGAIVGLSDVFSFIVVSFWIGAFISLMLLLLQYLLRRGKRYLPFLRAPLTMKSEVPFAPFLIFGFLIVHLFSIDVFVLTYEILFW